MVHLRSKANSLKLNRSRASLISQISSDEAYQRSWKFSQDFGEHSHFDLTFSASHLTSDKTHLVVSGDLILSGVPCGDSRFKGQLIVTKD